MGTTRLNVIVIEGLTTNFASERILLRKVGGGYIFMHRLLLDYFASLEKPSLQEPSPISASLQKREGKEELSS